MKFALLGDDHRVLPLLRALLAKAPGHSLAAALAAPRCLDRLHREGFSVPEPITADESIAAQEIDAAIVASDDARLLQEARRLAGAGKALLVLPFPGQTTAFAYELMLQQAESSILVLPLFAWRAHPLVQTLHGLLDRQALGAVRHVQLERRAGTGGALRPERVSCDLLEDIDLLRLLLGEIEHVTAVRSGDATGNISLETVTLGSRAGPQVSWSITESPGEDVWRLTVAGEAGRILLHGDTAQHRFSLVVSGIAGETSAPIVEQAPGRCWLDEFERAAAQPNVEASANEHVDARGTMAEWIDLTRALEVVEGAERSIRRRRTIDLEFEAPSERSQFKTHMTAAGCSLLMLTLAAVIVYLVVAPVFNPTVKRISVVLIFVPLGIFLALQLFYFIARPGRTGGRTSVASHESSQAH